MATMKLSFSILLVVASVMLVSFSHATLFDLNKVDSEPAMFIFGDSLSDVGNNQYFSPINFSSFYPYGDRYFHHPTGRAGDGRLIPDIIGELAGQPRLTPFLEPGVHDFTKGTNFASIAAGVLVEILPGITLNLHTQVSLFKNVTILLKQQLGEEGAQKLLKNAVYLISIGGNDYFFFSAANPNPPESLQNSYVDMVVGNLTNIIKDIYDLGGRKIAIQSTAPVGCEPRSRVAFNSGDQCAENVNVLCRKHYTALSNALNGLSLTLQGFKYSFFDLYNALLARINSPSQYGFTEEKSGCCGSGPYRGAFTCGVINVTAVYELCSNPNEYVFFDAAHGTDKLNQQLAELFWNGSTNVVKPYNLKQLFEIPSATCGVTIVC